MRKPRALTAREKKLRKVAKITYSAIPHSSGPRKYTSSRLEKMLLVKCAPYLITDSVLRECIVRCLKDPWKDKNTAQEIARFAISTTGSQKAAIEYLNKKVIEIGGSSGSSDPQLFEAVSRVFSGKRKLSQQELGRLEFLVTEKILTLRSIYCASLVHASMHLRGVI